MLYANSRKNIAMTLVLCVLALIVFVPSLAFGQLLDDEGVSLVMSLLSEAGKDSTSPAAAGALLFLVVYLATKAPYTSKLLGGYIKSDVAKRGLTLALSLLPALATVLTKHMSWSKALGTALMSFAVSQAIFFLSKKKEAAAALVALLLVASTQAACISREMVEAGANGGADALEMAKPCVKEKFAKDEADCQGNAACLEVVRSQKKIVATGYDAFGCLLCTLDATAEGCATEKPCDRLNAVTK